MPLVPPPARHIMTFALSLRGGGVESAQLRLARGWLAAGRRVTLFIGSTQGPLAAEIPEGLEIIEQGTTGYLRTSWALPAAIRRAAPDILFCPGNFYTSMAAWARLRLGHCCPPIIMKISNALDRADHAGPVAIGHRLWLRAHPRFIDHVVAMTPAMADVARDAMHLAADRISVIANPPPVSRGAPPPLSEPPFILGVGRLEPQKRWDRLIAAFARLDRPDLHLVILGEGSRRTELEAQMTALGLRDRVALPGHFDPSNAYPRAALVALTSDFEGVPGVLREALAAGTPVVTTDSSVAVREIVIAPDLGTIVPRDDGDALVAALNHWLRPEAKRPSPVPLPGTHSAEEYLALFDHLVAARQA
jgi:glycosyltransferase involved in cell wall biosynthesis